MPAKIQRLLPPFLTGLGVVVAGKLLSRRLEEYDAQQIIGSGRFDPRDWMPWLALFVFVVFLALARVQDRRESTFLSLVSCLATVVVGSCGIHSFLVFASDVGQPPWQPATAINLAVAVAWTISLWAVVGLYTWKKHRVAFVLAVGMAAVELAAIPFLRPIWGNLR